MIVELHDNEIRRDGVAVGIVTHLPRWKRWRWEIGDAVGDEPSRQEVLAVARVFLRAQEVRSA